MARKRRARWSRLADRDLDQDHAYLSARNPRAAQRFAAEIFAVINHIVQHPELGPLARDLAPMGRYRHMPCGHHRVLYRFDGEEIVILRIWDTRRAPEQLRLEE